jgi:hypothetical protein
MLEVFLKTTLLASRLPAVLNLAFSFCQRSIALIIPASVLSFNQVVKRVFLLVFVASLSLSNCGAMLNSCQKLKAGVHH